MLWIYDIPRIPYLPQINAPNSCPYTRRPSSRPKTIMTCRSRSLDKSEESHMTSNTMELHLLLSSSLISDTEIRGVHPGGHRPKEWHFHSSLPKELLASEQRLPTDEHLSPHLSRRLYPPPALEKQDGKHPKSAKTVRFVYRSHFCQ